MQWLFGFCRKFAIDGNEVARARRFAGNDDLILAQAAFKRQLRGLKCREDHAFVDDLFGVLAEILIGVFLHLAHDQLLIERAAIHADAHGLSVVARHFANGGELFIAALAGADVAGVDAVFVERLRALRILRQQDVAVVVEIADDGRVAAGIKQPLLDRRDGCGGLRDVYGPADELRTSFGQFDGLLECGFDIGRVRVGHGLDDDRRAAAHADLADLYAIRFAARMPPRCRVKAFNLCVHSLVILA